MAHHQPANPFALMMDPDAIFAAIETSERLLRLKSRICRPLDEPRVAGSSEAKSFDEAFEAMEAAEPHTDADEGAHAAGSISCSASVAP